MILHTRILLHIYPNRNAITIASEKRLNRSPQFLIFPLEYLGTHTPNIIQKMVEVSTVRNMFSRIQNLRNCDFFLRFFKQQQSVFFVKINSYRYLISIEQFYLVWNRKKIAKNCRFVGLEFMKTCHEHVSRSENSK